jgi:3D (Asp-Asp-Asp) domain-containing protein
MPCYVTALESDYSGGSFTAGTATSSCVWSSRSFLTAFLSAVNLNGSGVDSSNTPLQREGFCTNAPGSSPAYDGVRYRRPTTILTSCSNPPTHNVTVASPSLACGTSVFIKTIGVRTVQDTGGGLQNDQIDNWMGIGVSTCNGWSNNRRRTIRFN